MLLSQFIQLVILNENLNAAKGNFQEKFDNKMLCKARGLRCFEFVGNLS